MQPIGFRVLICLLLLASTAHAAPVRNGTFAIEAKLEGWQPGATAYRFADDDGYTAPGCVAFAGPAPAGAPAPSQVATVTPNTNYVLSAALKSDGRLSPSVRLLRADGTLLAAASAGSPTEWTVARARLNSGAARELTLVCLATAGEAPAGARAWFDDIALLPASQAGGEGNGAAPAAAAAVNVARGCPVRFNPAPNYGLCTDPEDARQLTDGEYSAGYFWVQRGTVGWSGAQMITITLDLGTVQPIAGLSFNTAAGAAQVTWPRALHTAVSDDGYIWREAGNLVAMSKRPPRRGYAVHRYVVSGLKTRGRFVRLVVVPGGPYVFCDEIEVLRGPESLLAGPAPGRLARDSVLSSPADWNPTRTGIYRRLRADLEAARAALRAARLPAARKKELQARLDSAEQAIFDIADPDPETFRTLFPLNDTHARILAIHAPILRARGLPPFFAWHKHRYAFLRPHEAPRSAPAAPPTLSLRLMGGEFRAESFLLTNTTEQPVTARVRVQGLPGAPYPEWLRLSAVPWTDTAQGVPVAAALPDAETADGAYLVPVPAGITRKVWLTVDSAALTPGQYQGELLVEAVGPPLRLPLRLNISPIRMQTPRLSLGMWDYTNGGGVYGISRRNVDAAIRLQRSHFVDTPWATSGALRWPGAEAFDAQHRLKAPLTFDALDQWIDQWPGARNYFVFAAVNDTFAGAKIGTAAFNGRVASWAKALAQHLRDRGLKPEQLGILLVDEPQTDEQDAIIAAWAGAIKAAAPELTLFEDPIWERPDQAKIQEALTRVDILCPNVSLFYRGGPAVARYFAQRQAAGQKLWFYQCSGPARLFDPSRYHRLQSWHAFRYGAVGIGFWAFGDTGGAKSSWNEYAASGTAYAPAFLGVADATDSVHWQAVREGIEDYEYLAMLRDAAARAEDPRLKTRAEALLAEASAAVIGRYRPEYDWSRGTGHDAPDRYRLRVLSLLEQMR